MKKLVAIAALSVGFAFTAQADQLSDYLDSQYELTWSEETQFEQFNSVGIVDPLAAYDNEGKSVEAGVSGPVVDIAVMEIVDRAPIDEEELFVNTYE